MTLAENLRSNFVPPCSLSVEGAALLDTNWLKLYEAAILEIGGLIVSVLRHWVPLQERHLAGNEKASFLSQNKPEGAEDAPGLYLVR